MHAHSLVMKCSVLGFAVKNKKSYQILFFFSAAHFKFESTLVLSSFFHGPSSWCGSMLHFPLSTSLLSLSLSLSLSRRLTLSDQNSFSSSDSNSDLHPLFGLVERDSKACLCYISFFFCILFCMDIHTLFEHAVCKFKKN